MVDAKRYVGDAGSGKLSSALPKPNILRIEILDGNARERYLASYGGGGNIYTSINKMRKDSLGNSLFTGSRVEERVFYGFLSPNSDTTFNMSSVWENANIGGSVINSIKTVAGNLGSVGAVVNGAITVGQTLNDISNVVTQMNSTATGASTMSDFKSVSLNDFSVQCVWYIPEQEKIAKHSLKILYRMLYPRQITQDTSATMVGAAAASVTTQLVQAGDKAVDELKSYVGIPPAPSNETNTEQSSVAKVVEAGASAASGFMTSVSNMFGYNQTLNPFPVRVCVGQHVDIEPLVINRIDTKFSRETFISETDGRHLPLFAYTTVGFKYWLNPAPNLEFASLMGEEIFGDSAIGSK